MNILIYLLATLLAGLGLIFIVGAQGQVIRIVIGVILLVSSAAIIALRRLRPQHTTVSQVIDSSSVNVSAKQLTCQSCNGALDEQSVTVKSGAVFINCPFCDSSYQLQEDIKW